MIVDLTIFIVVNYFIASFISKKQKLVRNYEWVPISYIEEMKKYFFRKVGEGKSKRLVLNNIANKLIKILVALIISKKPYIKNFLSINPMLLKKLDRKST